MVKGHKILENQNIFDIANITLGGFDFIYVGLIQQNPNIENIDIDLNSIASETMLYDDSYYVSSTIQIQLNVPVTGTSNTIYGQENQSIYDLAIMGHGGLDNIYKLIQDNHLVSINEAIVSFKEINFDKNDVLNEALTIAISSKGYSFNTLVKQGNLVWDGQYIIWDGVNKLSY